MNWEVFLPKYIRNLYYYFRIKHRFPNVKIGENTQLDVHQLDTYEFGKGVIISGYIGPGCKVGDYTSIGGGTIGSTKECPVTIGKYCSIAPNTAFFSNYRHALNTPSTSSFPLSFANKREFYHNKLTPKSLIRVGNDVWIGRNAVITKGVTIGHGAVIGANAVATKDIEPYSIVGGVPARFIRKRFSEEKIKELLEMKWWDWPEEKIAKNYSFFSTLCEEDKPG